jgi:hypothetical protein
MAEFGTYSNTYQPFIPANVLPEPADIITWDWMETLSQFAQRFTRIATYSATVANGAKYVIDYSSLHCDFFPPLIKTYIWDSVALTYQPDWYGIAGNGLLKFSDVTLNAGTFENWTGLERAFHFVVMW